MNNIILTGFSGTGKSAIGKEIALSLGWSLFDTDDEIVKQSNKSIENIFKEDGESEFREIENRVLSEACNQTNTVIAVGGGAVVNLVNQRLMLQSGTVVCLEANTETIESRLFPSKPVNSTRTTVRPLLNVPNGSHRIKQIKESRQTAYTAAHWTVHTDTLTIKEVAAEVVRAWNLISPRLSGRQSKKHTTDTQVDPVATVFSTAGECPIYVGWGLLHKLGHLCVDAGLSSKAYIITDKTVSKIYGSIVRNSLESAGIQSQTLEVSPGESAKALDVAANCYKWLFKR